MFIHMDTTDLIRGGFVRRPPKSRTDSAKETDPCEVWPASAEGRGEGVWLLPASPGGVGEGSCSQGGLGY